MRYIVTQAFYDLVNTMVEVALRNGNEIEYELAFDLLRDLETEE
jgi:hypothetical protein